MLTGLRTAERFKIEHDFFKFRDFMLFVCPRISASLAFLALDKFLGSRSKHRDYACGRVYDRILG